MSIISIEPTSGDGVSTAASTEAIDWVLNGPGRPNFRGRRVVACLDSDQVQVKNARLPKMPQAELLEVAGVRAAEALRQVYQIARFRLDDVIT